MGGWSFLIDDGRFAGPSAAAAALPLLLTMVTLLSAAEAMRGFFYAWTG